MKVLFINSVCGIRSTGRIVADLADDFLAQGHDVKIAYGRENAPAKYKYISYRIGSETSVRLNGLKARIFDNEGLNCTLQTKKFIQWANAYDPDVVWLHNLHGYYINIELLFSWIKSRPSMEVRWTLHDCWAFTGHCAHFSLAGCTKWKTQCSSCKLRTTYPKRWLIDRSQKNFRQKKQAFTCVATLQLITPSHWLASLVKESFLKEYPVEVVHNKIDTQIFRPTQGDFRQRFRLQDKKLVLGVASAWTIEKGYADFLKLADLLDDSYRVILVGLSHQQLQHLPAKILGIQRTDSLQQLAEIYTAADVFVNLTYEDTYPTVNLEAQACGTPCLTYRTGGSTECVPPENVVRQGDLPGIVAKIQQICKEDSV